MTIFLHWVREDLTDSNAKGFALIATISVMVLLVMVALAMLSYRRLKSDKRGSLTPKRLPRLMHAWV